MVEVQWKEGSDCWDAPWVKATVTQVHWRASYQQQLELDEDEEYEEGDVDEQEEGPPCCVFLSPNGLCCFVHHKWGDKQESVYRMHAGRSRAVDKASRTTQPCMQTYCKCKAHGYLCLLYTVRAFFDLRASCLRLVILRCVANLQRHA